MKDYPLEVTCRVSSARFVIAPKEAELRRTLAVVVGDKHFTWPDPEISPAERHRQRLAFRNERVLYRNTSALDGKPLISSFSPDKPYKIVSREKFLDVDNEVHGQPFDFNRPVFDQFAELYLRTLKPNVNQDGEMVNSEYTHFCGWSKDCYLMFDAGNC